METEGSSERRERDSPSQMNSTARSHRAAGLGARPLPRLEPRAGGAGQPAACCTPRRRHGGEPLAGELIWAAVALRAGVERGGNGCPGRVLEMVLQTQG